MVAIFARLTPSSSLTHSLTHSRTHARTLTCARLRSGRFFSRNSHKKVTHTLPARASHVQLVHACKSSCVHVCMCNTVCVRVRAYAQTCAYVSTYVRALAHVCTYACRCERSHAHRQTRKTALNEWQSTQFIITAIDHVITA
jgi:hypothetical protein